MARASFTTFAATPAAAAKAFVVGKSGVGVGAALVCVEEEEVAVRVQAKKPGGGLRLERVGLIGMGGQASKETARTRTHACTHTHTHTTQHTQTQKRKDDQSRTICDYGP